jgi:protoporphyrinogen oxidase
MERRADNMEITILGGGLAALSLAYFLQHDKRISQIVILEKEEKLGGLLRSFETHGISFDIGPHILFSKNKPALRLINDLLGQNKSLIRRSNRIIHSGRWVQYPFENDLSRLPKDDLEYCLNGFVNNPYEGYPADNMLQFFLKTFGEGITNLYLRPYNEKIWKFDPSFMDTQMVERIPKPAKEDILKSATGETVDGYTHQLFFSYPKQGGIESLVRAFCNHLNDKVVSHVAQEIIRVRSAKNGFAIATPEREFQASKLVSTIPLNVLCSIYENAPKEVACRAKKLRYNSIIIAIVNVKTDRAGDNFAFMTADKSILFHRISKLDFLGGSYHIDGTVTYLVEITYRPGDLVDQMSDEELFPRILADMQKVGFLESQQEVLFGDIRRFEYAYVVYALGHRRNVDFITKFFRRDGLILHGRFGQFEYLNMDAIVDCSKKLAEQWP